MATVLDSIVAGAAKAITLPENAEGNLESGYVPPSATITFDAGGFGAAPDVVLFAQFMDGEVGEEAPLDSPIIGGSYNTGSYATGLLPKYFEIDGLTGISLREGGTDSAVDNRLTGFVKVFDPYDSFFVAFSMGVPDGRHFSGATATNTLPATSTLKFDWESDSALDDPEDSDIVCPSWNGSNWVIGGNQAVTEVGGTPDSLYLGGNFDFSAWNYFTTCQIAGSNAFTDDGYTRATTTTSVGTTENIRTSLPTFKQRVTLTITAQDSFLYRVTINAENSDYTSTTGQTATQIATQVMNAINTSSQPVSASQAGSKVFIDADVGTEFTYSLSANLSAVDSQPQYTHANNPGWSGSGTSQNLTQHLEGYVYRAHGANCLKHLALLNSNDASTSTIYFAVPSATWSDETVTLIPSEIGMPEAALALATHVMLFIDENTKYYAEL